MNKYKYDLTLSNLLSKADAIYTKSRGSTECQCCGENFKSDWQLRHARSWKHERSLRLFFFQRGLEYQYKAIQKDVKIKPIQQSKSSETNKKYQSAVQNFLASTEVKTTQDLTESVIQKYFSTARQSQQFYAVKQLCQVNDIPVSWDKLKKRPKVSPIQNEHKYHTEQEILGLIGAALASKTEKNSKLAVQFGFLYFTASRIQDLEKVSLEALKSNKISWLQQKTHQTKTDIVPQQLKFIVDEAKIMGTYEDLCLGYQIRSIRRLMTEFASQHNIQNFKPHDLRKSRLIELNKEVNVYDISSYLGHKRTSTTEIYLKKTRQQALEQIDLATKKKVKIHTKMLFEDFQE